MGRSVNSETCSVWWVPLSESEQTTLHKLGASVRRLRASKGMTQENLAEACELHLRSLQKIEAGDKNVLITTVQRIQRALACSWDELMK